VIAFGGRADTTPDTIREAALAVSPAGAALFWLLIAEVLSEPAAFGPVPPTLYSSHEQKASDQDCEYGK